MTKIKLPRGEWAYDPTAPLGKPGGFGAVYAGGEHGELAIKRLHLTAGQAAHREMRVAADLAGRDLTNVVPILDAGEDTETGTYFVVMARAESSLQAELDQCGSFADVDAAAVLHEILIGLMEVSDLVHRDLKPANVLLHGGRWKVADFGIARFVEDSTSLETLKGCLSPQYAAPEQWQHLRASAATDLYSLGCIGYALLKGAPPFAGRTMDELRDQHLHAAPPPTPGGCDPRLSSLLMMLLRKVPEARPSPQRVRDLLERIRAAPPPPVGLGPNILAQAGANVARVHAEAERRQSEALSEAHTRDNLARSAIAAISAIGSRLFDKIENDAPVAERNTSEMALGRAIMALSCGPRSEVTVLPPPTFVRSKWDVVVGEEIVVKQAEPEYLWSASLWYCRLPETDDYRWYEAAYFAPFRPTAFAPYSLANRVQDADLAASPISHVYQLAFGPVPIDDEDESSFIERWSSLLALAAEGRLGHPRSLPLRDRFWQQPFVA